MARDNGRAVDGRERGRREEERGEGDCALEGREQAKLARGRRDYRALYFALLGTPKLLPSTLNSSDWRAGSINI